MLATKLLSICLFALIAQLPLTCAACQDDLDIQFEIVNALNTSHHSIAVDISAPGVVERLAILEHGAHQTFMRTFDITNPRQRIVMANFTITDLATGDVITKRDVKLTIDRTVSLTITDYDFHR